MFACIVHANVGSDARVTVPIEWLRDNDPISTTNVSIYQLSDGSVERYLLVTATNMTKGLYSCRFSNGIESYESYKIELSVKGEHLISFYKLHLRIVCCFFFSPCFIGNCLGQPTQIPFSTSPPAFLMNNTVTLTITSSFNAMKVTSPTTATPATTQLINKDNNSASPASTMRATGTPMPSNPTSKVSGAVDSSWKIVAIVFIALSIFLLFVLVVTISLLVINTDQSLQSK